MNRRRWAAAAALAACALGAAGCAGAAGEARPASTPAPAGAAALQAVVDAAVQPVLQRHQVPGMAVAVAVRGQSFFFNYGVASRESGAPVTEATLFELGSVSKTFTATLGLYAQALGRLSLSEHPSAYLPALRGAPIDRARLQDLGTYAAGGLPLQFPDEVVDEAAMLAYFRQWQPQAAPGAIRRYSNPSIGLFGRLSSLALRRSYADALEGELLPGLGLAGTYVRVPPAQQPRYAWGYDPQGRPVRVNPGMLDAEAYGLKSSARDMLRFVQLQLQPHGLAAPLRRAVQGTHAVLYETPVLAQSLGWESFAEPVPLAVLQAGVSSDAALSTQPVRPVAGAPVPTGGRWYHKTGSTGGFGAYAAFVTGEDLGIVLLANRNYPNAERVAAAHAILAWLKAHPLPAP